jgi:hypothetical protein
VDLSERGTAVARHPWERARNQLFVRTLARHGAFDRPVAVLDVGAGDGWLAEQVASRLAPGSTVVCWDAFYTADDLAALEDRAPDGVRYTRAAPDGAVDWLFLLDVVEHVADDLPFVRDLVAENLRPGGRLLASVPAWPALYSAHDAALQHERRYSPKAFRTLLEEAGVRVDEAGGMFTALLLPRGAQVARERSGPSRTADGAAHGVGGWGGGRVLTAAVTGALVADGLAGQLAARFGVQLPGLSTWVVGRRA